MALQAEIEKTLGSFRLKVSFEAENGVLALLGASGCGKSLTLKCIAGIEKPDRGRITLGGRVLFDSERRINLPSQERRVGFLFQQYALFPNMTVRQNIACGVREKRNRDATVAAMIRRMQLEGQEDKKPRQLSGGQQQRVALARILVNEPDILMLDEPFSALDSHLRFRMEREVRAVLRGFDKPVLLVSHNRDEVFRMADRIAVMGEGCIETVGGRHEVFGDPKTRTGAVLTGCKNVSPARRLSRTAVFAEDWGIGLTVPDPDAACVGIRMHDIRPAGPEDETNVFDCRVEEEIENPFSFTLMLRPEGTESVQPIGWETDKARWRAMRSDRIRICIPEDRILILRE
ncbi:MAG: sulfate/molybdate ABC transporter ATP-binding protein [Clostridia bacterium]|nr:sulfate/molybdate ABC transporter ATP-binding protein [Clostridia bacterium]